MRGRKCDRQTAVRIFSWMQFLFFCFFFFLSGVILQHAVWHFSSMEPRVKGKTRGGHTEGRAGAMINGQPGYFRTGWQSEPRDHRSLARRSISRVPSAVRQQWKAKYQGGGVGRWGREKVRRGVRLMVGGLLTIAAGKGLKQPSMSQTWT